MAQESRFFLSVLVENENDCNDFILDIYRKPFDGTFDDAKKELLKLIHSVQGILNEGMIEEFDSFKWKLGVCTMVEDWRYEPFSPTHTYNLDSEYGEEEE